MEHTPSVDGNAEGISPGGRSSSAGGAVRLGFQGHIVILGSSRVIPDERQRRRPARLIPLPRCNRNLRRGYYQPSLAYGIFRPVSPVHPVSPNP